MSRKARSRAAFRASLSAVLDKSDSARKYDVNGWFEVERNPLSKAGVYEYLGRNLPGAPDPDAVYLVYRPPEELADPDCISSFKLMPWIDDHTPGMMGDSDEGLIAPEDYGVHGVIGEKVFYENGVLYGNIKLWSESLRDLIADGKKELSLGYRAKYDWTPGTTPDGKPYHVVQRFIRGNHIASVDDGRMGSEVAVLDAADTKTFNEVMRMAKATKPKVTRGTARKVARTLAARAKVSASRRGTMDADDTKELTLAEAMGALNELMPVLQKFAAVQQGADPAAIVEDDDEEEIAADIIEDVGELADDEEGTGDEDDEGTADEDPGLLHEREREGERRADKAAGDVLTADEDDDEGTADEDDLKDGSGMDAADIVRRLDQLERRADFRTVQRQIKARDELARSLSVHVGTFDHSDMTTGDVARYGAKKLGLKVRKGTEIAAVQGYLAGAQKPAQRLVSGVGLDGKDAAKGAKSAINKYRGGTQ